MSSEESDETILRRQVRRALQVMNLYSLTEFEYEDKENDRQFRIRRGDQESSPPLLEGRSGRLAGAVRAPAVGRVEWDAEDGDVMQRGDQIATIVKDGEEVPVKAPIRGALTEINDHPVAEYGDRLARIVPHEGSDEDDS